MGTLTPRYLVKCVATRLFRPCETKVTPLCPSNTPCWSWKMLKCEHMQMNWELGAAFMAGLEPLLRWVVRRDWLRSIGTESAMRPRKSIFLGGVGQRLMSIDCQP